MVAQSQQIEWLSLVETSGPFLTLTVLEQAFPQGLESIETPRRQQLRSAYYEWRDAVDEGDELLPQLHDAWVNLVLTELLEFDEESTTSRSSWAGGAPSISSPDGTVHYAPTWLIHAPGSPEPRTFISVTLPDADIESASQGDGWIATEIERMTLLCREHGVRIGIVTNGESWVLINVPADAPSGQAIWHSRFWFQEPATLKAFQSLLGVRRYFGPTDQTLEALFDESLKHQEEVTDTLGDQVRRATEVLIQALDKADQDRNRELLRDVPPSLLYEASVTVMMRLVFVLCAEERSLFLLGDPMYDQNIAVSTLRGKLAEEADQLGDEILERRYDAWARLLAAFRAVYAGIEHEDLRLPAMGGSLFDPDRYPFLEGRALGTSWLDTASQPLPIDNRTVLLLLNSLQVLEQSRGALALSYRALDVEQIGHVYEGLLDHTVVRLPNITLGLKGSAKNRYPTISLATLESLRLESQGILVSKIVEATGRTPASIRNDLNCSVSDTVRSTFLAAVSGDRTLSDRVAPFANLLRSDAWGEPVIYRAHSFMVAPGADRRESGTHYTPRLLTEQVVGAALDPLVYIGAAEGQPREHWVLKPPGAILDLKVCDPAMGSGAFLVQACRYLAERLVEAWSSVELHDKVITADGEVVNAAGATDLMPAQADARINIARRLVSQRCLYGVDINPLAVELAKLSIWLITLSAGKPFGFLDHNLRSGDSLLGVHRTEQLVQMRIDPAPGEHQTGLLDEIVVEALQRAVSIRHQLRSGRDLDITDVTLRTSLDQEARNTLSSVDLVADAFIGEVVRLGPKSRSLGSVCDALALTAAGALDGNHGEREALQTIVRSSAVPLDGGEQIVSVPFHWALQFPEVFAGSDPGFDCVVSNPPYVSFYGRDSVAKGGGIGARLAEMHSTIDGRQAMSGRVNLFLLFLSRCIQIAPTGYISMVLPDTVITNESYGKLREALTASGRVRQVVHFDVPQFKSATVGTATVLTGKPRSHGTAALGLSSGGKPSSLVIESIAELLRRPNCSWLPLSTAEIQKQGLPVSGTRKISEFAEVRDGINPGSASTRQRLLTEVDDDDETLRLCMEGKWITPYTIVESPLWVRYSPKSLSPADKKAGASLRESWIWDSPKIVYRQTAPHVIAAVDSIGLAARNSVHSIVLNEHSEVVLYALCGFLNSAAFRAYYQASTGETRKVFPQVHISSVKSLRVPTVLLDPVHPLTVQLAELSKSISSITYLGEAESAPPPDEAIVREVDSLVERLFAATWTASKGSMSDLKSYLDREVTAAESTLDSVHGATSNSEWATLLVGFDADQRTKE